MTQAWSRQRALEELRGYLWRYLSSAATVSSLEAVVEDLWRLKPGEMRRLAATHVALDASTEKMLAEAPGAIRRLRSSVVRRVEEQYDRVDGPVLWGRTMQRRWQTGKTTLFVTRPAERQYDTPEARLVLLCLRTCADLHLLAELRDRTSLGVRVAELSRRARQLGLHAKLQEVADVANLPERVLDALARRGFETFVTYWRTYRDAVLEVRTASIVEVVSRRLLSPAADADVFELLVGFRLLEQFEQRGFSVDFAGLLPDGGRSFARIQSERLRLTMWWQRSPWLLPAWSESNSTYGAVLDAAGLSLSRLRPDFVVEVTSPRAHVVLVEVKHTTREGSTPDRAGITDALAYLRDAQEPFEGAPEPHVVVVAQNSAASPVNRDVVVAGPDRLPDVVNLLLAAWS